MDYPKNKMEWIIIDDSDGERLDDLIPDKEYMGLNDMDINYIKLETK